MFQKYSLKNTSRDSCICLSRIHHLALAASFLLSCNTRQLHSGYMTLQVVFRSLLKNTEDILSVMGHLEIAMLAHTCTSNSTNWAQLHIMKKSWRQKSSSYTTLVVTLQQQHNYCSSIQLYCFYRIAQLLWIEVKLARLAHRVVRGSWWPDVAAGGAFYQCSSCWLLYWTTIGGVQEPPISYSMVLLLMDYQYESQPPMIATSITSSNSVVLLLLDYYYQSQHPISAFVGLPLEYQSLSISATSKSLALVDYYRMSQEIPNRCSTTNQARDEQDQKIPLSTFLGYPVVPSYLCNF